MRSKTLRRMKVWGEPVSRSACVTSPPLCIANLVVNETSSSVTVPPTRQGPCSDNEAKADARSYLQNFLALVGRRVREIGRKLLKKTLSSAGRGQQARLWRGRNFVDSSIPHGSKEPTNGGRVCQPGLSVANFFANCRKRLTEQIFFPFHWRGYLARGSSSRRPMPHSGSRGQASANRLLPVLKGDVSWRGSA